MVLRYLRDPSNLSQYFCSWLDTIDVDIQIIHVEIVARCGLLNMILRIKFKYENRSRENTP